MKDKLKSQMFFHQSHPAVAIERQKRKNLWKSLTLSISLQQEVDENTTLVHKQYRVDLKTAVKLRKAVIVVSWISIIVLALLGVSTFVIAIIDDSSASFAFALDAILDCMSSIVVIWRFAGASGKVYSVKREAIACLVLGCLFLVSAVSIAIKSTLALKDHVLPETDAVLFYFALTNGIVCVSLVVSKVYLAYKLESKSILTDAVNSMIGAILAFSILASEIVFSKNEDIWQIDPVTGVVCSVLLLLYGIWIIVHSLHHLDTPSCSCCKVYTQEDKTKLDP